MPPAVPLNPDEFWLLAPEIFLAGWGLFVLVLDLTGLRHASNSVRRSTLGGIALTGALLCLSLWILMGGDDQAAPSILAGAIANDSIRRWFGGLMLGLLALVVVLSMSKPFTERWGEFFSLCLWACVGMMFLVASQELILVFVSLELMTIALYLLAGFAQGRRRSAEAGLKYFVYGSVSSALFLFGLSLIYGMTGSTRLEAVREALLASDQGGGLSSNLAGALAVVLLLVGFGFKVAAVPFHQWAPDTYEGAPSPISAWIACGSKVASFIALIRVLVHALAPWAGREGTALGPGFVGILALISAASMSYGNFAALSQRNLKRLMAYSSIAHAGYMLVGVLAASVSIDQGGAAAGAVLFYMFVYAAGTLGVFGLAAWMARDLGDEDIDGLDGLGYRSPALAVCVTLLLLSLVGVPPLAGFIGKLSMFLEALNTGSPGQLTFLWLVAIALVNSVISAFYYTRILRAMFLKPPRSAGLSPAGAGIAVPIAVCAALLLILSLAPHLLFEPMNRAALPLVGGHPPVGDRVASN
ncbi:MAG: NADH-quinone oxidoreductase subunit N [Isosphaeraceae bacterium]